MAKGEPSSEVIVRNENEALRAARERTESPAHPGECLSRQELAELVNEYVYRHANRREGIDANYVGKVERGLIRWPNEDYRAAFRAVLGVSTDEALGFSNSRRRTVKVADMNRKQFLRVAGVSVGLAALGSLDAFLEPSQATVPPTRIGRTEVEQVHTAARVFKSWDAEHGGGLSRETVLAQLRWSARLLDSTYPEILRPELFSAVAYLASVHGFMCFDAYAFDDSRRTLRFALACAEEAEDWGLRAEILSRMARQDIHTGHPDQGMTWIEYALVRADRVTPTTRAMLHTVRGRALAKMGRRHEALRSVALADEFFADRQSDTDPKWLAYYDASQHAGDTAHALMDLSLQGVKTDAAERFETAVSGHVSIAARSRVLSQTKLATLHMATGDPREGVVIGNRALDAAASIRSNRVSDCLRELARYSRPHERIADVPDLRHRITNTVLA
ncbi:helix-turn-helix domain-containing protein [Saccharothrix sp. ALI-22-I]|uniref:helix-turn-helix domain-containing protein n=1 Tax=Saccharothrix sp. ALI-22-I TaxID=1933778 RepID=UPI001930F1D7|nr:XRE family transcriptional regulator [Saccharothrix sp. ALI-22-I]